MHVGIRFAAVRLVGVGKSSKVRAERSRWSGTRRAVGGCGAIFTGLALLTACSGGSGNASPTSSSGAGIAQTRNQQGVGQILTDSSGKTLYSNDQESASSVLCTGDCVNFWKPLNISGGTAPSIGGVTLGTVKRPDGATQATYRGRPLYTFTLDKAPGDTRGNNFTDKFGSNTFTWHAATAGDRSGNAATPAPVNTSTGGNPYGY